MYSFSFSVVCLFALEICTILCNCIPNVAHHESVVSMSRLAASSDGSLEDGDKNSRTSQTQAFITELMNLLRCDSEAIGVQIRETVKELVSYELSPLVYPYLFQCMMEDSMKVHVQELYSCTEISCIYFVC